MKKKLENIVAKLQTELPEIKSRYNVITLEVFGSFVRHEENTNSDLDILVSFSKAPSLFKFIELEDYLSKILGVKVDLVMKSSLKPNIGKRILSEAQSIL
ncbi:MAG TPA: DNA polymerase III subunit beta [Caldithrix abyssi]|uniref:DNA polymerase III subunit beta n=1 Tax=Caldithrix abyssi TaxID=187145 RepID=A0A7V4WWC2_CALAY|nr:DNA polymerase III subunit beta [Caldithrix abyssi]